MLPSQVPFPVFCEWEPTIGISANQDPIFLVQSKGSLLKERRINEIWHWSYWKSSGNEIKAGKFRKRQNVKEGYSKIFYLYWRRKKKWIREWKQSLKNWMREREVEKGEEEKRTLGKGKKKRKERKGGRKKEERWKRSVVQWNYCESKSTPIINRSWESNELLKKSYSRKGKKKRRK